MDREPEQAQDVAATISIEYRRDELVICVDNDGGAQAMPGVSAPAGNGITGMRERAAALRGRVSAGPSPGSGRRVHAVLPSGTASDPEPTP
ncbi:hypothetical protein [Lentzea sp. NPDC051838]|uniref:ATP-binding protein n=1 Tax=Lentzea sp. NPDC051838 TaxID=3154849 RepID=UPI0034441571